MKQTLEGPEEGEEEGEKEVDEEGQEEGEEKEEDEQEKRRAEERGAEEHGKYTEETADKSKLTLQPHNTPHDLVHLPHVQIRVVRADRVLLLEVDKPRRDDEVHQPPEAHVAA